VSTQDEPPIRVLGPLELWHSGQSLRLPGALPQTMAQLMLLRAGWWCDTEELVDILWAGRPPRSASVNIRSFVCQWRKVLQPFSDCVALEGRRGAYRIAARHGSLDAHTFEALIADGDRALGRGDSVAATDAYESALRLWRGTPFSAVTLSVLPERTRLIEIRDKARAGLVTALLATDRLADAIIVLQESVAVQQYDEKVWARLITTLTATGRRVAALDAYRRVRALLREELGVEPGHELRAIHSQVLMCPR